MKTALWIIVAIIIIVGGIFLFSMSAATPAPASVSTSTATTTAAPGIIGNNLALGTDSSTTLGNYLVGYTGMPVYSYKPDSLVGVASSTCYGACASTWPPYIVSSSDDINNLESGVSGTVGTITRTDGTLQLTYDNMPLYFYTGDATSSSPTGQNVDGFTVVNP